MDGSVCPRAEEGAMLRNRFLILLGVSFLAASAAWADDVGYIDCSNHSEGTQVFGKPRKTPDVVAALPCGERFTILLYGFVFSRIETRDGKVGYIYSNLIAVDRNAAAVQQSASSRMVTASEKVPVPRVASANPNPPAPAPAQSAPTQASAPPPSLTASSASSSSGQAVSAQSTPAATTPAPLTSVSESSIAPVAPLAPPAPAQPQPPPVQSSPATASVSAPSGPESSVSASPAPTAPTPTANLPEAAPAAQPDPQPAAQPEPAAAPPAIRPANSRASWESPHPSARHSSRVEVFGGYAFARLDGGGGYWTNMNGGLGSFGLNLKPWLQIVADSSYSFVTAGTTKNVLYGNHYGPRYFHRSRNRWGATPFVEALFGASRADTTITGPGGYTISNNSFSYKVGGGIDLHPSSHWEIRLFDVDYYRTSFGPNIHQNNYWASTGIVLRLFGGANDR